MEPNYPVIGAGNVSKPCDESIDSCDQGTDTGSDDFRSEGQEDESGTSDGSGNYEENPNFCLKNSENFLEPGPYGSASKAGPSGYTVFYPEELEKGCKHPFVVWGNGTTQRGVASYGVIGKHLASHGIFVIHTHADGGGGLRGAGPMKEGIQVAKDLGDSGEFAGAISRDGGSSGHSQGGIGAQVLGSSSPEIKAVVDMMGGAVAGARHDKPTLLLTGSQDFMRSSINQAFGALDGKIFLADFAGVEHMFGPMRNASFRGASAAWFRCNLAKDNRACQLFVGKGDASLFKGATTKSKNL